MIRHSMQLHLFFLTGYNYTCNLKLLEPAAAYFSPQLSQVFSTGTTPKTHFSKDDGENLHDDQNCFEYSNRTPLLHYVRTQRFFKLCFQIKTIQQLRRLPLEIQRYVNNTNFAALLDFSIFYFSFLIKTYSLCPSQVSLFRLYYTWWVIYMDGHGM